MSEITPSPSQTIFVRIHVGSRAAADALADAAEARGATGVFTSRSTVDVSFAGAAAALRFAVAARDHYDRSRIGIHRGRFVDSEYRGIDPSSGPAHMVLAALADAAAPHRVLMSEAFFDELGSSGGTAFDANSRDLGRVVLEPGLAPRGVHALAPDEGADPPAIGETNLPVYLDSFVGRDRELSHLSNQFDRHRVVTLTGPPGAGKTRLAVEFGHRHRNRERDSDVWGVDLRRADSFDDVVAGIASSLRLPVAADVDGDDALVDLGRAIASRGSSLIILDGIDGLVGSVAVALQTLLPVAPAARWLATATHPLNLVPEREIPIEGLGPSSAVRLLEARRSGTETVGAYDEPRFEEALRAVDLVGGSPLALRLAAGIGPIGPPGDLLELLEELLDAGADPLDSLAQAAIRDLDTDTRRTLRLVAVADAPVPLGALREAGERLDLDVDRHLADLLRRGLLDQTRRGRAAAASFYDIPGAVRHALGTDGEGRDRRELAEAFTAAYRRRAADMLEDLESPRQPETLDRIGVERSALLATIELADETDAPPPTDVAVALGRWYAVRGPRFRQTPVLESALETFDAAGASRNRGELLIELARADQRESRTANVLDEAEAVGRSIDGGDDLLVRATARRTELETDPDSVDPDVLDPPEGTGRPARIRAYLARGRVLRADGEPADAGDVLERARRAADEAGAPNLIAEVRREEARAASDAFRFGRARDHLEEALDVLRTLGSPPDVAETLVELAEVERHLGDPDRALRRLRDALDPARRSGSLRAPASIRFRLGRLRAVELRFESARESLLETLDTTEEYFWPEVRAPARAFLGAAEAALGREESARRAFERAETELENLPESTWNRAFPLIERTRRIAAVEHGRAEPVALRPLQREFLEAVDPGPTDENVLEAVRLFDRYLTRIEGGASRDSGDATRPTRPSLLVDPEARWFRAPGRDRVDISRRDAPRLIFARLVRHRREFPGTPLELAHLAEVGWPAETLDAETAKNRVYRAVSTLRDLGLREILVTRDPGYLLSPKFAIRRAAGGGGSPETG